MWLFKIPHACVCTRMFYAESVRGKFYSKDSIDWFQPVVVVPQVSCLVEHVWHVLFDSTHNYTSRYVFNVVSTREQTTAFVW